MSYVKAEMHQIRFRLWLQRSPRPSSWIYGSILLRERRGREGKGEEEKDRVGEMVGERAGRKKGKGRVPTSTAREGTEGSRWERKGKGMDRGKIGEGREGEGLTMVPPTTDSFRRHGFTSHSTHNSSMGHLGSVVLQFLCGRTDTQTHTQTSL